VVPALTKQFKYKNPMQVPRLQKIVLNMGLGAAVANQRSWIRRLKSSSQSAAKSRWSLELVRRSRTSSFERVFRLERWLRCEEQGCGSFLTGLSRGATANTRLQGVSRKAFDGKGNYTLGLREQIIFAEVNYDKIDAIKGLNISFVTTAKTDEEGRALLQQLGMPFRAT